MLFDTEGKLFPLTSLKRESGLSALRPRVGHNHDLHTINFCEFYSPQWSDKRQIMGSVALGYQRERKEGNAAYTLLFQLLVTHL